MLDFTDEQLRLWLTLSFFLAEQTDGGIRGYCHIFLPGDDIPGNADLTVI